MKPSPVIDTVGVRLSDSGWKDKEHVFHVV